MRYIALLCFVCSILLSKAQIGGSTVYSFVSLQPSARVAALGGAPIAITDADINLTTVNPALLNSKMSNQITYSYQTLPASIRAGYVGFCHSPDTINSISLGMQYIRYGDFTETDASGIATGNTFTAAEYNTQLGYSRSYGRFSVGGRVKFIHSVFETYKSYGVAIDAGVTYNNPEKFFTLALVASNYGKQLKTYRPGNSEPLPFNVQLGASKSFKHNPLRFGITINHLEKPGELIYQNTNKPGLKKDLETGQTILEDLNFGKKMMSHVVLSGEVLLGKNFYLGLGYNYLKQWEMKLEESSGFSGFSWGFGFKVSKFQFAYAYTGNHIGYGNNHFSFIVYVNDFLKKKS